MSDASSGGQRLGLKALTLEQLREELKTQLEPTLTLTALKGELDAFARRLASEVFPNTATHHGSLQNGTSTGSTNGDASSPTLESIEPASVTLDVLHHELASFARSIKAEVGSNVPANKSLLHRSFTMSALGRSREERKRRRSLHQFYNGKDEPMSPTSPSAGRQGVNKLSEAQGPSGALQRSRLKKISTTSQSSFDVASIRAGAETNGIPGAHSSGDENSPRSKSPNDRVRHRGDIENGFAATSREGSVDRVRFSLPEGDDSERDYDDNLDLEVSEDLQARDLRLAEPDLCESGYIKRTLSHGCLGPGELLRDFTMPEDDPGRPLIRKTLSPSEADRDRVRFLEGSKRQRRYRAEIDEDQIQAFRVVEEHSSEEEEMSSCWQLEKFNWLRFSSLAASSPIFETIVCTLLVVNALAVGVATELKAQENSMFDKTFDKIETVFCMTFLIEWTIRISAAGFWQYFTAPENRNWHVFDTIMVLTQILDQIFTTVLHEDWLDLPAFRMLRVLRVIRVTRLLRTFQAFDDLRVIVASIVHSSTSLLWAVALLASVIYMFSIIFLQIILQVPSCRSHQAFKYWFPSVFRTLLTLFESIVGGVSWDVIIQPMVEDIHPAMGLLFCMYIAFALFAMMNLLTGVFVDHAMRAIREDKDLVLAKRIADLFLGTGSDECPDELTWEDFADKLDSDIMKEYFKQMNVELSEGRHLFDLLDVDSSGSVDCKEIVEGCLRLRGPARAFDLNQLARQVHYLHTDIAHIMEQRGFERQAGL
eukprot:TRINITY_DN19306_c1_g1_i1.p1 TRINITY_DN19306_c1_g1~~TRINITY_DN19306_c1_g1_i1.p1  ORF type:complete len:765 (+),score=120.81 TRINITY_DN19306_c1_g1_i1:68-2362(+)